MRDEMDSRWLSCGCDCDITEVAVEAVLNCMSSKFSNSSSSQASTSGISSGSRFLRVSGSILAVFSFSCSRRYSKGSEVGFEGFAKRNRRICKAECP